jgi:transcriptional regulator with XRE-family HTH domain
MPGSVSYHSTMSVTRIHKGKTPTRIHYVAEWMEKRGLRPADIVDRMGVNKGTVSKWCGGALPSEENVLALADMFEIEPNDLFRHPDDDWLSRMFLGRKEKEAEQMREALSAFMERAFPRKDGTNS